MKRHNKFFIIALALLLFLSISIVSADDNQTVSDNPISDENQYDSQIIAKDVNVKYSPYNHFNARLVDDMGIDIYGENLKMVWSDGVEEGLYEWDDYGGYNTYIDRDAGNYKLKVVLTDSNHTAKPADINVKIAKAKVKLTAEKWHTTSRQYATLKVKIKDHNNDFVDEGTVKFKINGKSYTVKVSGGIAVKKIRLFKAKTYTYKATFTGKNYNTKSVTSKVYVYSISKSARTIKMKGYKIIIPVDKYKKLVNAKNTKKVVVYNIKTGKSITQTVPYQKTTYKWKYMGSVTPEKAHKHGWKTKNFVKHWKSDGEYYYTCDAYKKVSSTKVLYKTVKANVMMLVSYGGKYGAQNAPANKYGVYLNTPYQNPGYDGTTPCVRGYKQSDVISKLNNAKLVY